ncbi:hypothetical protein HO173_001311 [Letharia columbiana]|uniref:Uncharacterized protein n=1 Tax=Letharia columbiana TaxID=112416 RepID=A0A8H6L9E8_9LECA|nr:uncharacterized protein HO173_001311 [Letharia columbiana]KAF6240639.1 hypothetical protein HO173_001311 [Letharia columbiana]
MLIGGPRARYIQYLRGQETAQAIISIPALHVLAVRLSLHAVRWLGEESTTTTHNPRII